VLTSGVKDSLGNPITTTELLSDPFTVGSENDTTAPVVSNFSPPDGTTGVDANTAQISATVSDYMLNTLSINPRNVQLSYVDGATTRVVAGTVTFTPQGSSDSPPASGGAIDIPVTFKPACALRPNTQYTVTFKGGSAAKPIRDVVGNVPPNDTTWSFTTAP
jgi:hypothetical protein